MTLSSMTGFGRSEGTADWGHWTVEAKSVNGRGLDVRLAMPHGLDSLEADVKAAAKARFARGNFQVSLSVHKSDHSAGLSIDRRFLAGLARERRKWVRGRARADSSIEHLLAIKGVLDTDTRSGLTLDEAQAAAVLKTVGDAMDGLKAARLSEGQTLQSLLTSFLDEMEASVAEAIDLAERTPEVLRTRMQDRVAELLKDTEIDPDRLAQEVALLAAKADVREEIDRLTAHIADGRALIASGAPVGRKLDFLSQELHREANTLGSKSTSLELTRISLALKALIDQFKEQSANVE